MPTMPRPDVVGRRRDSRRMLSCARFETFSEKGSDEPLQGILDAAVGEHGPRAQPSNQLESQIKGSEHAALKSLCEVQRGRCRSGEGSPNRSTRP